MKKAVVISDLHMFCRRSHWEQHLPHLHEAASKADLFVFNGDTFDFRWTSLTSVEETIRASIRFLRDFAKQHPQCQVHVNLGNHDHLEPFMQALDRLARHTENLSWDPYYLRVGSTLFLHGDAATHRMDHDRLERNRARRPRHHRKQGRLKNRVYDAAVRAGAHVAVSRLVFPRRRTAKCLSAYLEDIGHGSEDGVTRVYFGHTHVPLADYTYQGITFHNGGAAFEGINFSLLQAAI